MSKSKLTAHELRRWSIRVRWRDRRCQICGSRESLEAHHLNNKAHHPEQAYDIENGIALCGNDRLTGNACHRTFHVKFKGNYRRKCTLEDWERFKEVITWARDIGHHTLIVPK